MGFTYFAFAVFHFPCVLQWFWCKTSIFRQYLDQKTAHMLVKTNVNEKPQK